MAHENDLTITQLAFKMDAMWSEMQRKFDHKFESIQEQIEQLESPKRSSKKSRGKLTLNELSDSNSERDFGDDEHEPRDETHHKYGEEQLKGIKLKIPTFQGKSGEEDRVDL